MNRAKPRSGHGDGLWRWLADGEVAVDQITANPLLVTCPTCHAGIRQHCTRPSRWAPGGRANRTPHDTRLQATNAARDALRTAPARTAP